MAGNAQNIIVGPATLSVGGVDVGYTKDGVRVRSARDVMNVMADQVVGVVKKSRTNDQMFVSTTLLEATLANLAIAWDLLSAGTLGRASAQCVERVIEVIGLGPNGTTRTFTFQRGVSNAESELNYGRDTESALEVEFEILKNANGTFGAVVEA